MSIYFKTIPTTNLAGDSDVDALIRHLESGNLEAHEDGTLGPKESKISLSKTCNDSTGAAKKKLGDIPRGVLGAESLRDILARSEQEDSESVTSEQQENEGAILKEGKKVIGSVPSGVLGMNPFDETSITPEVEAMINEFRSEEEADTNKEEHKSKLGDIPSGVLGVTINV